MGAAGDRQDHCVHVLECKTSKLWRRDTVPAAFHYFSMTQGDSRGLQGNEQGNELQINSLPRPALITKVAHRRHFSKTRDAGSIPAASTINSAPSTRPGCERADAHVLDEPAEFTYHLVESNQMIGRVDMDKGAER